MAPTEELVALPLRIAMIGYGKMGRAHSHGWRAAPAFFPGLEAPTLQVAVGRNQAAVAEFAQRFGWAEASTDWEAVVSRPDIDVVDICSPVNLHGPIALAALKAGKHVLCEKPLAMTPAEAREMADIARSSGRLHMIVFNYRFVPALQLAKRLMDRGELGRIYQVRARFLQDWLADPAAPVTWKVDPAAAGGGVLVDLGSHAVDLIRYLVGDLEAVIGLTQQYADVRPLAGGGELPVAADEAALFLGRLPGGAIASVDVSRVATGYKCSHSMEIHGELGALRFDFERMNELQLYSRKDPADAQGFRTILATRPGEHPYAAAWWGNGHPLGFADTFTHLALEFLTALKEGRPASPNFDDGEYVQRVLSAVTDSVRHGAWTTV